MTTERWIAAQPGPVQAVLLDASRDDGERVLPLLYPRHADVLDGIACKLAWVERLETELAADVLGDYYERPIHGIHLDRAADNLASELRADALVSAQLLASLLAKRVAA